MLRTKVAKPLVKSLLEALLEALDYISGIQVTMEEKRSKQ
jgi:hypothetical protein